MVPVCLTLFLPGEGGISPLIVYHVTTSVRNRVKLRLPTRTVISQGLLNSLPKLRYLWRQVIKSRYTAHQDETWIKSQYPQISYNEGNAQIACCAIENFEPKLGFWELKCTVAEIPKTWEEHF